MGPEARGLRAEGPRNETGLRQTRVSLSHPRVDICPGIVRPRPYVCSLSGAPNSLVEIGNKRKSSPTPPLPFAPAHGNIWQGGSMNRADSLAVSIADFVPRKSIAFAVTPAKNRDLLKSSAILTESDRVNAETRADERRSRR